MKYLAIICVDTKTKEKVLQIEKLPKNAEEFEKLKKFLESQNMNNFIFWKIDNVIFDRPPYMDMSLDQTEPPIYIRG